MLDSEDRQTCEMAHAKGSKNEAKSCLGSIEVSILPLISEWKPNYNEPNSNIFLLYYVLSMEVERREAEISTQMTFHSKLT